MPDRNKPFDDEDPSLPVASFVNAVNATDLRAAIGSFAHDAVVNDQLSQHSGIEQISEWLASEIIGCEMIINVIRSTFRYGTAVVIAEISGNFDKRGLPDPLLMTFYFSCSGEKLVQLVMLRTIAHI
jgi:hypothetical protein